MTKIRGVCNVYNNMLPMRVMFVFDAEAARAVPYCLFVNNTSIQKHAEFSNIFFR